MQLVDKQLIRFCSSLHIENILEIWFFEEYGQMHYDYYRITFVNVLAFVTFINLFVNGFCSLVIMVVALSNNFENGFFC